MALADEYAFANGLALIDGHGGLIDLAIVEGIGQTVEPLVRWLASGKPEPNEQSSRGPGRQNHGGAAAMSALLLSVRPYEADLVREEDLRLYRNGGWAISAAGLHLIDWIETDGDLFRSYAYLMCPATAWPDDPPMERPG